MFAVVRNELASFRCAVYSDSSLQRLVLTATRPYSDSFLQRLVLTATRPYRDSSLQRLVLTGTRPYSDSPLQRLVLTATRPSPLANDDTFKIFIINTSCLSLMPPMRVHFTWRQISCYSW